MPSRRKAALPAEVQRSCDAITRVTNETCARILTDEYSELAQKMARVLAERQPSELITVRPEVWAGAILHAIGYVNVLFDKSAGLWAPADRLKVRAKDIFAACGAPESSGYARSKEIVRLLGLKPYHPQWYCPSRLHESPYAWVRHDGKGLKAPIGELPDGVASRMFSTGLLRFKNTAPRR